MSGSRVIFSTQHHHYLHRRDSNGMGVIDGLDDGGIGIGGANAVASHVAIRDLVAAMSERVKMFDCVLVELGEDLELVKWGMRLDVVCQDPFRHNVIPKEVDRAYLVSAEEEPSASFNFLIHRVKKAESTTGKFSPKAFHEVVDSHCVVIGGPKQRERRSMVLGHGTWQAKPACLLPGKLEILQISVGSLLQ